MSQSASTLESRQNIVDRARPELDDFLARFYHQIGVYAVARELGQPTEEIWGEVQSTLAASTAALASEVVRAPAQAA